ncbi:uncharacterized protein LOC143058668 [Mytilus galloprovincialis]|uniref:uncharacterized protein LOC143058668 n=1 Tax=Mytilus galloprovincialis TaxID=29158 RepID=UPI003F7C9188
MPQQGAIAAHPWIFSTCSSQYFTSYIDQLDSANNNCLKTLSPSFDPTAKSLYDQFRAGQVYNADSQCVQLHGDGSYLCRTTVHMVTGTVFYSVTLVGHAQMRMLTIQASIHTTMADTTTPQEITTNTSTTSNVATTPRSSTTEQDDTTSATTPTTKPEMPTHYVTTKGVITTTELTTTPEETSILKTEHVKTTTTVPITTAQKF